MAQPPTKARPQIPYETRPLENDPTSGSSGRAALQGIPERPAHPKPKPPMAPPRGKSAGKGKEQGKREEDNPSQYSIQAAREQNWVPISVINQGFSVTTEQSRGSVKSFEGGNQFLGFGRYAGVTYNESWKWICEGRATINGLVSDSGDMMQEPALNLMTWIHRANQAQ